MARQGGGRPGEGSPDQAGGATRKWLPRSLGCRPKLSSPCVPLPPQQGWGKPRQGNVHVPKTCPPLKMDAGQPAPWRYGADLWAASGASRSPQPPPTSSSYQEREDSNFEECSQTPTGVGVRRPHGHFLGCCQSARRPSLGPGPRWRSGPLLTCLSLSAAIRGCLS